MSQNNRSSDNGEMGTAGQEGCEREGRKRTRDRNVKPLISSAGKMMKFLVSILQQIILQKNYLEPSNAQTTACSCSWAFCYNTIILHRKIALCDD